MSKLIKRDEDHCFEIECFEADDVFSGQSNQSKGAAKDQITLPVGMDPSSIGGNSGVETFLPGGPTGDRLARLEREAYEKGFEQGRSDGLDLEKKQIEEKGKRFEALFKELSGLKEYLYTEAEGDILNLSLSIAKQIIKQETKTDPSIIKNAIQSATQFINDNSRMRISLNPEDMEEVKNILPELAKMTKGGQFQLVEDRAIEQGGCMIETGFGKINATVEDQLWKIEKEIKQEFELSKRQRS